MKNICKKNLDKLKTDEMQFFTYNCCFPGTLTCVAQDPEIRLVETGIEKLQSTIRCACKILDELAEKASDEDIGPAFNEQLQIISERNLKNKTGSS